MQSSNSRAAAASSFSHCSVCSGSAGCSGNRAASPSPMRNSVLTVPCNATVRIGRCAQDGNCSAINWRAVPDVTASWSGCISTPRSPRLRRATSSGRKLFRALNPAAREPNEQDQTGPEPRLSAAIAAPPGAEGHSGGVSPLASHNQGTETRNVAITGSSGHRRRLDCGWPVPVARLDAEGLPGSTASLPSTTRAARGRQ